MTVNAPYRELTAKAPVNIAVIKYWGKRDTELILPTNSSLSITLDIQDLHSKTSVRASPEFTTDRFWLNGQELDLSVGQKRIVTCIRRLRERRKELEVEGKVSDKFAQWPLHIASENNFPTAAGLASSASGLACLVFTLARLYELVDDRSPLSALESISRYARLGSGSACRSIFGGYVKWEMGELADGSDSYAVQVAPAAHWPEIRALILVVNDAKKDVSSTQGMQSTVETSPLFQSRIDSIVPERMRLMEKAIAGRDFELFAKLTMRDSNQFHAVCMETYPPIYYMNDTSRSIVSFVHRLNKAAGRSVVAYTFDAGPNAVLYYLAADDLCVSEAVDKFLNSPVNGGGQLGVKRVIRTQVGPGPQVVASSESLLSSSVGIPNY